MSDGSQEVTLQFSARGVDDVLRDIARVESAMSRISVMGGGGGAPDTSTFKPGASPSIISSGSAPAYPSQPLQDYGAHPSTFGPQVQSQLPLHGAGWAQTQGASGFTPPPPQPQAVNPNIPGYQMQNGVFAPNGYVAPPSYTSWMQQFSSFPIHPSAAPSVPIQAMYGYQAKNGLYRPYTYSGFKPDASGGMLQSSPVVQQPNDISQQRPKAEPVGYSSWTQKFDTIRPHTSASYASSPIIPTPSQPPMRTPASPADAQQQAQVSSGGGMGMGQTAQDGGIPTGGLSNMWKQALGMAGYNYYRRANTWMTAEGIGQYYMGRAAAYPFEQAMQPLFNQQAMIAGGQIVTPEALHRQFYSYINAGATTVGALGGFLLGAPFGLGAVGAGLGSGLAGTVGGGITDILTANSQRQEALRLATQKWSILGGGGNYQGMSKLLDSLATQYDGAMGQPSVALSQMLDVVGKTNPSIAMNPRFARFAAEQLGLHREAGQEIFTNAFSRLMGDQRYAPMKMAMVRSNYGLSGEEYGSAATYAAGLGDDVGALALQAQTAPTATARQIANLESLRGKEKRKLDWVSKIPLPPFLAFRYIADRKIDSTVDSQIDKLKPQADKEKQEQSRRLNEISAQASLREFNITSASAGVSTQTTAAQMIQAMGGSASQVGSSLRAATPMFEEERGAAESAVSFWQGQYATAKTPAEKAQFLSQLRQSQARVASIQLQELQQTKIQPVKMMMAEKTAGLQFAAQMPSMMREAYIARGGLASGASGMFSQEQAAYRRQAAQYTEYYTHPDKYYLSPTEVWQYREMAQQAKIQADTGIPVERTRLRLEQEQSFHGSIVGNIQTRQSMIGTLTGNPTAVANDELKIVQEILRNRKELVNIEKTGTMSATQRLEIERQINALTAEAATRRYNAAVTWTQTAMGQQGTVAGLYGGIQQMQAFTGMGGASQMPMAYATAGAYRTMGAQAQKMAAIAQKNNPADYLSYMGQAYSAELSARQSEASMIGQMPLATSEFEEQAQFKLQRQMSLFSEYGSVRESARQLGEAGDMRLSEIAKERKSLTDKYGDNIPANIAHALNQSEREAYTLKTQSEQMLQQNWMERIVNQSFGTPGNWNVAAFSMNYANATMNYGVRQRHFGGTAADVARYKAQPLTAGGYGGTGLMNDPRSLFANVMGGNGAYEEKPTDYHFLPVNGAGQDVFTDAQLAGIQDAQSRLQTSMPNAIAEGASGAIPRIGDLSRPTAPSAGKDSQRVDLYLNIMLHDEKGHSMGKAVQAITDITNAQRVIANPFNAGSGGAQIAGGW